VWLPDAPTRGDIHGKLSVYEWLVDQTSPVEVLALAGDRFDADLEDQQRLPAAENHRFCTGHKPRSSTSWAMTTTWSSSIKMN
jgi:hypothetical protein